MSTRLLRASSWLNQFKPLKPLSETLSTTEVHISTLFKHLKEPQEFKGVKRTLVFDFIIAFRNNVIYSHFSVLHDYY